MRSLTSTRLMSTLPLSGERQAREWATSGDWEPDSSVAEALRLHQIERDLIVQGSPDGQIRSDRLLEAQSRHDYALYTLQQASVRRPSDELLRQIWTKCHAQRGSDRSGIPGT